MNKSLLEELKEYFDKTSKETSDKMWDSVKHLNEIGPDVMEYHKKVMENIENVKNQIKEKLHKGVVKFVYTKNNGEERHATGTLNVNILEEKNATPKGTEWREMPDDVIKYFDIDKNAWRSFNISNFIKMED